MEELYIYGSVMVELFRCAGFPGYMYIGTEYSSVLLSEFKI